jgi:hypothetical protein
LVRAIVPRVDSRPGFVPRIDSRPGFAPRIDSRLAFAPHVDVRLVAAVERLDDRAVPIAETYRRLRVVARALGLFRPSYEQVRRLIHLARRRGPYPSAGSVLLETALRTRPPAALVDYLVDTLPPRPP